MKLQFTLIGGVLAMALTAALGQQPLTQGPNNNGKLKAKKGVPTPRTADGKVDFSGIWEKPYVPDMSKDGRGQKGMPDLPFTPWGEAEWKNYDVTMHFNGESIMVLDGAQASGERYCLAHLVKVDGPGRNMVIASIRYLDTFVKNDGVWFISSRNGMVNWTESRSLAGVSAS